MNKPTASLGISAELATKMALLSYVPATPERIAPLLETMEDFYTGFEAIRQIPVGDEVEGLAPYLHTKGI